MPINVTKYTVFIASEYKTGGYVRGCQQLSAVDREIIAVMWGDLPATFIVYDY